jgi:hypothetical protein
MISRTSIWSDEKQPCNEAYIDTYVRVDERTVDNPEKLNGIGNKKDWYENGKNHRVENGHIKRDFDDKAYFIDINSLEELTDLYIKYGELIIGKSFWNPDIPSIEIYDSYRE